MANRNVILYGASETAKLKRKFSLRHIGNRVPVAFCDRDVNKQGKQFLGLPVLPFEAVVREYIDFDVYITANERNTPNIIGFLVENGISQERIINYEPVEKRKGCIIAESNINLSFSDDKIDFTFCNILPESGTFAERPKVVLPDMQLSETIYKKVFSDKKRLLEQLKNGAGPASCQNCPWAVNESYHFVYNKIRHLNIIGYAPCNYSCHNCSMYIHTMKNSENVWDLLLDSFKVIEKCDLVAEDCIVTLALGEYSIAKKHRDILQYFRKYPLYLLSNAYVWSDATANALSNGHTFLQVSVDAGTRETYLKIKGVDGFVQVCNNLEKYSRLGTVVLKYIIFQGINTNSADFNGFYELCEKLNAKVDLSRDYADDSDFTEETLAQLAELIIRLHSAEKFSGIVCRPNEKKRLNVLLQSKGYANLIKTL